MFFGCSPCCGVDYCKNLPLTEFYFSGTATFTHSEYAGAAFFNYTYPSGSITHTWADTFTHSGAGIYLATKKTEPAPTRRIDQSDPTWLVTPNIFIQPILTTYGVVQANGGDNVFSQKAGYKVSFEMGYENMQTSLGLGFQGSALIGTAPGVNVYNLPGFYYSHFPCGRPSERNDLSTLLVSGYPDGGHMPQGSDGQSLYISGLSSQYFDGNSYSLSDNPLGNTYGLERVWASDPKDSIPNPVTMSRQTYTSSRIPCVTTMTASVSLTCLIGQDVVPVSPYWVYY
jgi:hypothetical protein